MQPDRWEPDRNIVAAVLATPKYHRKMKDLGDPDRSWLVAGLTLAGLTAQAIAERMTCSLRLVRTIRAYDMTQVCYLAQQREAEMADEIRQVELGARLSAREMEKAQRAATQARLQLGQVIDAHIAGTLSTFPRCGHPKVPYNVYKHGGREYCRTCRTDWDQTNRKPRATCPSVKT